MNLNGGEVFDIIGLVSPGVFGGVFDTVTYTSLPAGMDASVQQTTNGGGDPVLRVSITGS